MRYYSSHLSRDASGMRFCGRLHLIPNPLVCFSWGQVMAGGPVFLSLHPPHYQYILSLLLDLKTESFPKGSRPTQVKGRLELSAAWRRSTRNRGRKQTTFSKSVHSNNASILIATTVVCPKKHGCTQRGITVSRLVQMICPHLMMQIFQRERSVWSSSF